MFDKAHDQNGNFNEDDENLLATVYQKHCGNWNGIMKDLRSTGFRRTEKEAQKMHYDMFMKSKREDAVEFMKRLNPDVENQTWDGVEVDETKETENPLVWYVVGLLLLLSMGFWYRMSNSTYNFEVKLDGDKMNEPIRVTIPSTCPWSAADVKITNSTQFTCTVAEASNSNVTAINCAEKPPKTCGNDSYTCAGEKIAKNQFDIIKCGKKCTDDICCKNKTCEAHSLQCAEDQVKRPNFESIECGTNCAADTCCQPRTCGTDFYECSEGYTHKFYFHSVACGETCTDYQCCKPKSVQKLETAAELKEETELVKYIQRNYGYCPRKLYEINDNDVDEMYKLFNISTEKIRDIVVEIQDQRMEKEKEQEKARLLSMAKSVTDIKDINNIMEEAHTVTEVNDEIFENVKEAIENEYHKAQKKADKENESFKKKNKFFSCTRVKLYFCGKSELEKKLDKIQGDFDKINIPQDTSFANLQARRDMLVKKLVKRTILESNKSQWWFNMYSTAICNVGYIAALIYLIYYKGKSWHYYSVIIDGLLLILWTVYFIYACVKYCRISTELNQVEALYILS